MKGQKLHIRPLVEGDEADLRQLAGDAAADLFRRTRRGLAGRLVGDLVAFAVTSVEDDRLILHELFVRPDLRRKRIGTLIVGAVVESGGPGRIVAPLDAHAAAFLRHSGFEERDGFLERTLR